MSANDGSETVEQFLARVASVRDSRNDDELERSQRIEAELLKSKAERQARRAERARSLSPSKTGPATAVTRTTDTPKLNTTPPITFSPNIASLSRNSAAIVPASTTAPTHVFKPEASKTTDDIPMPAAQTFQKTQGSPTVVKSGVSGLSRSGTLSWQQRPTSRDGGAKIRNVPSLVASRPLPARSSEDQEDEQTVSRKEISASLLQKDPAWFRQTQERGVGSAALRKSQVEDAPLPDLSTRSIPLPGLPDNSVTSPRTHTASNSSTSMLEEPDRFRRGITPDIAALRESMSVPPPKLEAANRRPHSQTDSAFEEVKEDSSSAKAPDSQAHNGRPISPTKGFGGFVESAMMKRSDSVSKRWSVQANTGLRRGDSVAGMRPSHARGLSRDVASPRDGTPSSPLTLSRPGSSHEPKVSPEQPRDSTSDSVTSTGNVPIESRTSQPVADGTTRSALEARPHTPVGEARLARSPSRTTDPRRWSPTKSSWLESALNTTAEPPKLQPLLEEQPKWKIDLQRSKSKRGRDLSPEKAKMDSSTSDVVNEDTSKSVVTTEDVEKTSVLDFTRVTTKPFGPISSSTSGVPRNGITTQPAQMSKDTVDEPSRNVALQEQLKLPEDTQPLQKDFNQSRVVQPVQDTNTSFRDVLTPSRSLGERSKPPQLKPKPQTPPKTDFRSSLKAGGQLTQNQANQEPEFKSVFGKLKRATTQNYVAPDVLKDNILSGKAALSITEGPKKTKHVDEFKESILAKKEAWKASGAGPPEKRAGITEKTETPVPEALQRRKTLSKPNAPTPQATISGDREPVKPLTVKPSMSSRVVSPKPVVKATSLALKDITSTSSALDSQRNDTANRESSTEAEKVIMQVPRPVEDRVSIPKSTMVDKSIDPPPKSAKPITTPTPLQEKPGLVQASRRTEVNLPEKTPPQEGASSAVSKIASRLNPNLAAVLSRGPNPHSATTTENSIADSSLRPTSTTQKQSEQDSGELLTHMTKGRAKGPKRRAPKVENPLSSEQDTTQKATTPSKVAIAPKSPTVLPDRTKDGNSAQAAAALSQVGQGSEKTTELAPKPLNVKKSPLRPLPQPPAALPSKSEQDEKSTDNSTVASSTDKGDGAGTRSVPKTLKPKPVIAEEVSQNGSASPKQTSAPAIKPKTSLQSITSITAESAIPVSGATVPSKSAVLTPASLVSTPETLRNSSPRPERPVPGFKPQLAETARVGTGLGLSMTPSVGSKPLARPPRTITPPPEVVETQTSSGNDEEIRATLEAKLGSIPRDQAKPDFDVQTFLANSTSAESKCKTLQHTIFEITSDGRKSPMLPQQDHILYEESMYVITHTFSTSTGTRTTEVYLWHGDRVPETQIEDVQLFCKRDAREHNARLEIVKQGSEHSRLLQAIGGILIVRRSKTASFFMLCGRKHLGHIVFDEVDIRRSNLCPGFTYLISAQFGKLYLWKGKGASADEIGSARLIGMDLGLTGEIEEIEQGEEKASFWNAFSDKTAAEWSSGWHSRAEKNGYPTALYRVEHEKPNILGSLWGLAGRSTTPAKGNAPKVVMEHISPFSQKDLDTSAIHVLDTYRTIYILVNDKCSTKGSEFVSAAHVAQDIAMLVPSIQDRSVLPECFVVTGEPPLDVKACLRKWTGDLFAHTNRSNDLCVPLGKTMQILGL